VARPYSEKFLLNLQRADGGSLGVQLGRLCVEANLPAAYVAKALETSRISVYNWFRGRGIRENKRRTVEVFMDLVKQDMKAGYLPARTVIDAKIYIESMIGVKI
jgi:hypothetical protein